MPMQLIMICGHDFPKDKGVGNVNIEPIWGKSMCHGENPLELSTNLFLVFLPNNLFYQKVVEVVIAWKG